MAYDRWLTLLPHMTINTTGGKKPPLKFVSFDKYYKSLKQPEVKKGLSTKSAEEILEQVRKVVDYNYGQHIIE